MIAKLFGIIDTLDTDSLIINVNGVGYLVFCSSRTLLKMPPKGGEIALFIETVVREDAIMLYGFASENEKRVFNILTTVQGVGTKVGLAILSAFNVDELEMAIGAGDAKVLCKASGVGNKLAVRIVTELKGKIGVGFATSFGGSDWGSAPVVVGMDGGVRSEVEDAVSALVNLGYSKLEAIMAVNKVVSQNFGMNAAGIIREALKEFAK